MANTKHLLVMTFDAAADLSAKQYTVVKFTDARTVGAFAAATDVPAGVLLNSDADAALKPCDVVMLGVTSVLCDAITAPQIVSGGADGKIETSVSTTYPLGQLFEDAAAGALQTITINTLNPVVKA